MLLGKLDIHVQGTETRPLSSPCTNIYSKFITVLNISPDALKPREEGVGKIL
jgi:hypothetical protein